MFVAFVCVLLMHRIHVLVCTWERTKYPLRSTWEYRFTNHPPKNGRNNLFQFVCCCPTKSGSEVWLPRVQLAYQLNTQNINSRRFEILHRCATCKHVITARVKHHRSKQRAHAAARTSTKSRKENLRESSTRWKNALSAATQLTRSSLSALEGFGGKKTKSSDIRGFKSFCSQTDLVYKLIQEKLIEMKSKIDGKSLCKKFSFRKHR